MIKGPNPKKEYSISFVLIKGGNSKSEVLPIVNALHAGQYSQQGESSVYDTLFREANYDRVPELYAGWISECFFIANDDSGKFGNPYFLKNCFDRFQNAEVLHVLVKCGGNYPGTIFFYYKDQKLLRLSGRQKEEGEKLPEEIVLDDKNLSDKFEMAAAREDVMWEITRRFFDGKRLDELELQQFKLSKLLPEDFAKWKFVTEQERKIADIIKSNIDISDNTPLFASARFGGTIDRAGRFIKFNEVAEKIGACLGTLLIPAGFKYKKSKKEFVREHGLGADTIGFYQTNYAFYNVNFSFGLRYDAVNKISAPIIRHAEINSNTELEKEKTIWYVLSRVRNEIQAITWNYIAGEFFRLMIFIELEALPLFESQRSLEAFNRTVNHEAFEERELYAKNHFVHFASNRKSIDIRIDGLVSAFLTEDPKFEQLYHQYLEIFNDPGYAFNDRDNQAIRYTHDTLKKLMQNRQEM